MDEQQQFEIAKNWLTQNGSFKSTYIDSRQVFKVEFIKNEISTVFEGEDLIKTTIRLHYEVMD